jgi:hypothetical protein
MCFAHSRQIRVSSTGISSAVFFAALVAAAGCGGDGRPKRVAVAGQVLIDGEPLTVGTVSFIPVEGGRPAGGKLDESGRFQLTSFTPRDGVVPGRYHVVITAVEYQGETAQKWFAPKKYADVKTSGPPVDIEEATDELKFELSWDGGKPFVERLR